MKIFFNKENHELVWKHTIVDRFWDRSAPVKLVGPNQYIETEDEASALREYAGSIYHLAEVSFDGDYIIIDGVRYKERDELVFEVDDEED